MMFDDLGGFLTLLIGAIAIAAAGGTGYQRGKIGKLRQELDDADKRANRIGSAHEETKAELAEARSEVAQMRLDLDALGRVVTGEAHWIAISQQLSDHDDAARAHWREQLALLAELVAQGKVKT